MAILTISYLDVYPTWKSSGYTLDNLSWLVISNHRARQPNHLLKLGLELLRTPWI